jgi:hypothetical protein
VSEKWKEGMKSDTAEESTIEREVAKPLTTLSAYLGGEGGGRVAGVSVDLPCGRGADGSLDASCSTHRGAAVCLGLGEGERSGESGAAMAALNAW